MTQLKALKEHGTHPVRYKAAGPVSLLTSSEARTLGFHNYQLVDILKGEGDPDNLPTTHGTDGNIYIKSATGSGPLYTVTIVQPQGYWYTIDPADYDNPNLKKIAVGDKLFVGDDIDNSAGGGKRWYRYDIYELDPNNIGITAPTSGNWEAEFTVKYISDTGSGGDTSPSNLYYEYDAYGASEYKVVIARETTPTAFFFG